MKAQTCWERVKTAASEAEEPQSTQQKSVYRKGDVHRRFHSIQQKVGAALRLSQEPLDEDELAEFRCMRGDARAAVQEKDAAHVAACETLSTWSKETQGSRTTQWCWRSYREQRPHRTMPWQSFKGWTEDSPQGQCNTLL